MGCVHRHVKFVFRAEGLIGALLVRRGCRPGGALLVRMGCVRRHVKVGCRAMSRPWAADPFLKDCMHEFIEKQNSITKIIQYKPTFKDMYSQNRTTCFEDVAVSSRIKDLAYAPHRYHSESKALLRLVLTWDAALTTAAQVPLVRGATSPEGASMIQTISKCTAEMALQLGMLADMALECSQLVQQCDVDEPDEAELMDNVDDFKAVLYRLFVQGMCTSIPGLTSVVMNALQRPRTFIIAGRPQTFGSTEPVDGEIVTRCLKRMASAVVLSGHVLLAEFPEWDLLASFRIFDVGVCRRKGTKDNTNPEIVKQCARRLCSALHLNEVDFLDEYHHFLPRAAKTKADCPQFTNFEAWREAILRTQKHGKQQRAAHPAENIKAAVLRLGCWSSSSSTVERSFEETTGLHSPRLH